MSEKHDERCPICFGSGVLDWVEKYNKSSTATIGSGFYRVICHGCDGKGWIVVERKENERRPSAV